MVFQRVLSYLCFSVEQGKGSSSEGGAADLSNIVSLFLDSAGNDFIFFPSPHIYNTSVFSRQSFSSDSMGSDSGITSHGWCIHLSLTSKTFVWSKLVPTEGFVPHPILH